MQAYLIVMPAYQKRLPLGFRRKIKIFDVVGKTLHDLILKHFLLLSELLPYGLLLGLRHTGLVAV